MLALRSSSPSSLLRALVLAAAAVSSAGCAQQDCAYQPSQCPTLDVVAFCIQSGACTSGNAKATCSNQTCRIDAVTKLVIPLDQLGLDSHTPDFVLSVPGNDATGIAVALDGKEVTFEPGEFIGQLVVPWTKLGGTPKKLEVWLSGGNNAKDVGLGFDDEKCLLDEHLACHGGGE